MFLPQTEGLSDKKRWIGYATNIIGKITVNSGAKKALVEKEKSLLPIGVTEITNEFKKVMLYQFLTRMEMNLRVELRITIQRRAAKLLAATRMILLKSSVSKLTMQLSRATI